MSEISRWRAPPASQPFPLIIAHRGASSQAPENTMAAFKTAVEVRADAIELDVRLSKDKHVMVMHDRRLNRTTTGQGTVGSHTLEDLKTLDAGSWFDGSYKAEPVPTLEEVFQQVPADFLIYVEMKVSGVGAWSLAREVAKLVEKHKRWESTMVASFNSLAVRFLRIVDKRIIRGYIWSSKHPLPLRRRWLVPMAQPYWLAPDRGTLTPELLRKLQKQGHPVAAWDLDAGTNMRQLMEMKLDGAVTDHPEMLVEQRSKLL